MTGLKICSDRKCEKSDTCEACVSGKMQKKSCPNRAGKPLEMIHCDVCGLMQIDSLGGSRYVLSFIDDFSRYATVFLLKKFWISLKPMSIGLKIQLGERYKICIFGVLSIQSGVTMVENIHQRSLINSALKKVYPTN